MLLLCTRYYIRLRANFLCAPCTTTSASLCVCFGSLAVERRESFQPERPRVGFLHAQRNVSSSTHFFLLLLVMMVSRARGCFLGHPAATAARAASASLATPAAAATGSGREHAVLLQSTTQQRCYASGATGTSFLYHKYASSPENLTELMRRIVRRGGRGRKQDNVPKEVGSGYSVGFFLICVWGCTCTLVCLPVALAFYACMYIMHLFVCRVFARCAGQHSVAACVRRDT